VLADYRRVLDLLAVPVGALTPADLGRPTPCTEWDVATLLGHVLGAIRYYAELARHAEAPARPVLASVAPTDDLARLLATEADAALAAWAAPGALDRTVTMVLGPMRGAEALAIHAADLAVHAWDLAAARGDALTIPADLAAGALATWERVLATRDLRGIVFADPRPAPAEASPTARLVAFCGRDPG
jgi:uncharacterized protein (TIGR03086 family)